jgi:hypothetical protein
MRQAVRAEIYQACTRLGAEPERAATISKASHTFTYHACSQLGAGSELLSILGSYGDTLNDSDVFTFLKAYNAGKPVIIDLICSVESDA